MVLQFFRICLIFLIFFIVSCEREINPLCWGPCTEGTLYYRQNLTYPNFFSDSGDSLSLVGNIPKKFRKDGIRVCIEYKEYDGPVLAINQYPVVELTCIQKN